MPFDSVVLDRAPDLSTGRGRLRHLLWFFENVVSPEEVDLNEWVCGTQACLGGWATQIPEFRDMGLLLSTSRSPQYGADVCYGALAEFFELDDCAAWSLFSPTGESGDHHAIALRRLRVVLG